MCCLQYSWVLENPGSSCILLYPRLKWMVQKLKQIGIREHQLVFRSFVFFGVAWMLKVIPSYPVSFVGNAIWIPRYGKLHFGWEVIWLPVWKEPSFWQTRRFSHAWRQRRWSLSGLIASRPPGDTRTKMERPGMWAHLPWNPLRTSLYLSKGST